MIKGRQNEIRQPDHRCEGNPLGCWNRDPQAQSLRVELDNGGFCLLPYAHLTFAKLERVGNGEALTVCFTTHDLRILGGNLRELGLALQKFSVDWIKEVSARYATLADSETVFVEKIEVIEAAMKASS